LTVRPSHGVQCSEDQLLVFELILHLSLLIIRDPNVHPGIIIACSFYPQGCRAVGGLAPRIGCDITGDIDGKELVLLIPLVLSPNLVFG
jgi:hypothetical protein